jgi:DNA-binding transcriptional MerR regulator
MSMFSIGEFSHITRVTPRQLRHYEELGLFRPEHIDPETGYRFYSAQQLPRLNRIMALKDLGLSLSQILRLLDEHISAEEIRGMLMLRKAQIEQTLLSELDRVRSIESRLDQLEEQGELLDDVVLKAIPTRTFLSLRQVVSSKEEGVALMAELHRSLPRLAGRSTLGQFAVHFPSHNFEEENVVVEMGFLLSGDALENVVFPDGRVMIRHLLPAIETMATTILVGTANHARGYGRLGTWIERHHFQMAGPGWQVFIEPFQSASLEQAVIEIQLPVKREGDIRGLGYALLSEK